MTQNQAKAVLIFLDRANLQGSEAGVMVELQGVLREMAGLVPPVAEVARAVPMSGGLEKPRSMIEVSTDDAG